MLNEKNDQQKKENEEEKKKKKKRVEETKQVVKLFIDKYTKKDTGQSIVNWSFGMSIVIFNIAFIFTINYFLPSDDLWRMVSYWILFCITSMSHLVIFCCHHRQCFCFRKSIDNREEKKNNNIIDQTVLQSSSVIIPLVTLRMAGAAGSATNSLTEEKKESKNLQQKPLKNKEIKIQIK
jgi:uncharacterized membrane protein